MSIKRLKGTAAIVNAPEPSIDTQTVRVGSGCAGAAVVSAKRPEIH